MSDKPVCLVSGAASGLGEATVHQLVSVGWRVGALDLPGKSLPANPDVIPLEADILNEDQVKGALDFLETKGAIRGLVHCAGVAFAQTTLGKFGRHPSNNFEWVIRTNVLGSFQLTAMASERMAANQPDEHGLRGAIILTSSVAAFDGQRGQVAYAASKGAVASMVLPLARDLARSGIRVMGIAPGVFDTPMLRMLPEDKRAGLAAGVLTPSRLGNPKEFGQLAESILANPYLNGHVIRLDGGLRMH